MSTAHVPPLVRSRARCWRAACLACTLPTALQRCQVVKIMKQCIDLYCYTVLASCELGPLAPHLHSCTTSMRDESTFATDGGSSKLPPTAVLHPPNSCATSALVGAHRPRPRLSLCALPLAGAAIPNTRTLRSVDDFAYHAAHPLSPDAEHPPASDRGHSLAPEARQWTRRAPST